MIAGPISLTRRQAEVVGFISRFSRTNGYAPTRADIANHFGFASANAAECHLKALQRKGALLLTRGVARSVVLNPLVRDAVIAQIPPK